MAYRSKSRGGKARRAILLGAAISLVAALAGILAPHAAAQGCAMCFQSAQASSEQGRAALRHGILILLVPAVGLFGTILAMLGRREPLG